MTEKGSCDISDISLYINRNFKPVSIKNQTETPWIEMSGEWTLGTGLFLFNDPDSNVLSKAVLPDITYTEYLSLLTDNVQGKWLPNWWASPEQIGKSARE